MKKLFLAALVLTVAGVTASQAKDRGHWHGHHRDRTVIVEQPSVAPLLGVMLLGQLLSQQQPVYEPQQYEPAPKVRRRAVEPKLRDNPIPRDLK